VVQDQLVWAIKTKLTYKLATFGETINTTTSSTDSGKAFAFHICEKTIKCISLFLHESSPLIWTVVTWDGIHAIVSQL